MNLWRPRIIITAVALVCAIIAVQRHYTAVKEMSKNMGLYARVLTAFEESHTGMMAVESDTTASEPIINQANEAACDIFGFPKGELSGKTVGDILPAPFREHHAEKMKQAIQDAKTGRSHVATMRCIGVRKDGTPVDVYVRVFVTKAGVVALVSLASETTYSIMGVEGPQNIQAPVHP